MQKKLHHICQIHTWIHNKIHKLRYIYDQSKASIKSRVLQILYKLYITTNYFVDSFEFVSHKHIYYHCLNYKTKILHSSLNMHYPTPSVFKNLGKKEEGGGKNMVKSRCCLCFLQSYSKMTSYDNKIQVDMLDII